MNSEFGVRSSEFEGTLEYLYTRLPMFSRIGAAALKPDLTNTLALCAALGNPQERFKSVHIAGTNGKGSTSHMLAAILQKAGYKTGLYTSPHLVDFRERIRVDGKMVSKDFVVRFVDANKTVIEEIEPSFFEITVAMAFAAFAEAQVDIAVIETGLGGRLDSTNIITPELSIITNISLDHTDLLGKTIPEIAREKAGIIKHGIPVVIGEKNEGAFAVFEQAAGGQRAGIYEAYRQWKIEQELSSGKLVAQRFRDAEKHSLALDLKGSYQHQNLATVLTAVDVLRSKGWSLDDKAIAEALSRVKTLTGLRGRWDIWQQQPFIVADVAHNPAGLAVVLKDWSRVAAGQKHIVVGFVRDKDVETALALFPKDACYHLCAASLPRALPATELASIGEKLGLQGRIYSSVNEAVSTAAGLLKKDDALLITGSFFIVGEAMLAAAITIK